MRILADLFLKVLNISFSAGWLILAVVALRLLLRKAPRWIHVLLWGIVAVRLLCPVSLESVLSLNPSKQVVSPSIMLEAEPRIHSGLEFINSAVNPILSQSFSPNPGDSVNPLQIWIPLGALVWLLGTAVLLFWAAVSCFRLKKQVRDAICLKDMIYVSDKVSTPFLLGFFRPRIYLPLGLSPEMRESVIAHENSHIRRKDHWWKPVAYVLLSLHWFNPLMWLGYGLLCRDIEMACDEKTVAKMERKQRADYSQALLQCSVSRRAISVCPLAFGEVSPRQRIRSVLNYKKPGFWIIAVSLVLCAVLAVCFLTDPKEEYPAFQNKQLAVWTQEGEHISQWNFFEIAPSAYVTLPGSAEMTFLIKEVTENGIWLLFEPYPLLDGRNIQELFLQPSDQITLMQSAKGGIIRYVFSVVDNSTIGENGIGVLDKYSALEGMPLNYTPEQARKDGCVVMVNGDVVSGKDLWWSFYMAAQAGTPCGIRIMDYYHYAGSQIGPYEPVYALLDLTFDGKIYHIRWFEDVTEYNRQYAYLLRFQGAAESENAAYKSYDRYVLTNDNTVTWKRIWNEMISSTALPGVTDHLTVFTDLIYPSDPGLGTLSSVLSVLQHQDPSMKIASASVNTMLMTLDIQVYALTPELEELVYSLLDPKFVRITVVDGEYMELRQKYFTLDDILALNREVIHGADKGTLLTQLYNDCVDQIRFHDPDHTDNLKQAQFSVELWDDRSGFLTAVIDDMELEFESLILSITSWQIDILHEDLEVFLSGWEQHDTESALEPAEVQKLNDLMDILCAQEADVDSAIQANPEAYREILSFGEKALWWAMEELYHDHLDSLRGNIQGKICRDIMASWGETYEMEEWFYLTGQAWMGQFQEIVMQMKNAYTAFYIRDNHPGAWVLLNIKNYDSLQYFLEKTE